MAGRGPAPKAQRVRERDNARRQSEFTVLTTDGVVRGPDLPDVLDWPQQTLTFWQALRTSPMAATWLEVDWLDLQSAMLLHADLWSGNAKAAGELRLRLAAFGITPEARLRLRLMVDEATSPESTLERLQREQAERTTRDQRTVGRRQRLLKAIEDDTPAPNGKARP